LEQWRPHWEREKRLWVAEEAKQWTKVLSKNQKRVASKSSSSSKIFRKRVRFAEKIVQDSPVTKSKPSGFPQFIKIGNLDVKLPCFTSEVSQIRGVLKKSFDEVSSGQYQSGQATGEHGKTQRLSAQQCSQSSHFSKAPHSPSPAMFNSFFGKINRFQRLGGCARCLELNHSGSNCSCPPKCVECFKRGHKFKFCQTRNRPRVFWRPKVREN
jgi:hypothetical protein